MGFESLAGNTKNCMKKLFFLIGSSGSGKTTAAKSVEEMSLPGLAVCYSDSIKVPSTEEMIKEFGSQEEWQRQNTNTWVKKIKDTYLDNSNVIFDVQSRPSFIDEACANNGVTSYKIILFDCSDEERRRRLVGGRNQPELANEQMMDWARYLREWCVGENCVVIDNTSHIPEQSLRALLGFIGR